MLLPKTTVALDTLHHHSEITYFSLPAPGAGATIRDPSMYLEHTASTVILVK